MKEERERELLLQEIGEWIATIENARQSPEVMDLIWQLEKEHHAYPQLIVSLTEN